MTSCIMQPEEFSIGIICPLPIEVAAMIQMLDERYRYPGDPNLYHLGRIGEHNIAIAGLPDGLTGIASATTVAERLWVTFSSVKTLLLVGIGGGVPTTKNDMRLGDVVVSRPDGKYGGVIQYDFGKSLTESRFEHTGALNSPPREILLTLAAMKANHLVNSGRLPDYLTYLKASQLNPYLKYPGAQNDLLFKANYDHAGGSDCTRCDMTMEINRKPRKANGPVIHYGTIASANQLMKDSNKRDSYNKDYDGRILCFEMEAAGLMNSTPCLVIRGISDYADSHKREDHAWHGYAAAAAAAFAKEFINTIPGGGLKSMLTGEPKKIGLFRIKNISNSFFVGRQEELAAIRQHLTADNSASQRRAIIWGVGGAGKTQLALSYALQYDHEFVAIFFVNAKDTPTIRKDYSAIARDLKLPEALAKEVDKEEALSAQDAAIEAVKRWFVDHDEGNWLLIIDNADDLDGVNLEEYIPATRKGHIIITTQDRQAAGLGPAIELDEMKQEDAEKLFLEKASITHPTTEQMTACRDIVMKLGRLALAVEHAGAYVHKHDLKFRLHEYVRDFEQKRRKVLEESPRYTLHKQSMMATYLMASEAIISRNRKAAYLITLLGVLDATAVPESLLLSAHIIEHLRNWNVDYSDDYHAAKEVLLSFSLIRLQTTEDGALVISMHSLVHQCVQARLSQSWQWTWLERSAYILVRSTETETFDRSYFPHLRHVLKRVDERVKQAESGQPSNYLWTTLAFLMCSHENLWWTSGMMQELYEYSKLAVDALEKEDGENERMALGAVTALHSAAVVYSNSKDASEFVLRRFLKRQMTPWAAAFVSHIEDGTENPTAFGPLSLAEVFTHTSSPRFVKMLSLFLELVGNGYLGRNQPELASLYYRIKQLPVTSTWISRMTALLIVILSYALSLVLGSPRSENLASQHGAAAGDRLQGNIDSTLNLLRQAITEPNQGLSFEAATYDYSKLLIKLGRTAEAIAAVDKLTYPQDGTSEADIARKYKSLYVWTRKAKAAILQQDHATHQKAKEILLQTYNTAKAVFSMNSLSTLHAGFLLQQFYSTECCYDASAISSYRDEKSGIFGTLYGTPAKLRREEGLKMGKVLLGQGALEEAVFVFQLYVAQASKELGEDDSVTREARRLLGVAVEERAEEVRDEKEGRVGIRWGSMMFMRDVSVF